MWNDYDYAMLCCKVGWCGKWRLVALADWLTDGMTADDVIYTAAVFLCDIQM